MHVIAREDALNFSDSTNLRGIPLVELKNLLDNMILLMDDDLRFTK